MKAFFFSAAAVALACAALAPSANAALVITEVMSGSNNVTENDWWELTNTGPASVDLGGYYWDDDGPNGNDGAFFPAYLLGAGESLVIVEADAANFVAAWGGGFNALDESDFTGPDAFSGLSGGSGDKIELWDADPNAGPANLLAAVAFPPATDGFSFEWFTNGASGGLSVAGEFGAFVAPGDEIGGAGTDVGSPGVSAVPSPGSLSCLFGLAILAIRRRGCSARIRAN